MDDGSDDDWDQYAEAYPEYKPQFEMSKFVPKKYWDLCGDCYWLNTELKNRNYRPIRESCFWCSNVTPSLPNRVIFTPKDVWELCELGMPGDHGKIWMADTSVEGKTGVYWLSSVINKSEHPADIICSEETTTAQADMLEWLEVRLAELFESRVKSETTLDPATPSPQSSRFNPKEVLRVWLREYLTRFSRTVDTTSSNWTGVNGWIDSHVADFFHDVTGRYKAHPGKLNYGHHFLQYGKNKYDPVNAETTLELFLWKKFQLLQTWKGPEIEAEAESISDPVQLFSDSDESEEEEEEAVPVRSVLFRIPKKKKNASSETQVPKTTPAAPAASTRPLQIISRKRSTSAPKEPDRPRKRQLLEDPRIRKETRPLALPPEGLMTVKPEEPESTSPAKVPSKPASSPKQIPVEEQPVIDLFPDTSEDESESSSPVIIIEETPVASKPAPPHLRRRHEATTSASRPSNNPSPAPLPKKTPQSAPNVQTRPSFNRIPKKSQPQVQESRPTSLPSLRRSPLARKAQPLPMRKISGATSERSPFARKQTLPLPKKKKNLTFKTNPLVRKTQAPPVRKRNPMSGTSVRRNPLARAILRPSQPGATRLSIPSSRPNVQRNPPTQSVKQPKPSSIQPLKAPKNPLERSASRLRPSSIQVSQPRAPKSPLGRSDPQLKPSSIQPKSPMGGKKENQTAKPPPQRPSFVSEPPKPKIPPKKKSALRMQVDGSIPKKKTQKNELKKTEVKAVIPEKKPKEKVSKKTEADVEIPKKKPQKKESKKTEIPKKLKQTQAEAETPKKKPQKEKSKKADVKTVIPKKKSKGKVLKKQGGKKKKSKKKKSLKKPSLRPRVPKQRNSVPSSFQDEDESPSHTLALQLQAQFDSEPRRSSRKRKRRGDADEKKKPMIKYRRLSWFPSDDSLYLAKPWMKRATIVVNSDLLGNHTLSFAKAKTLRTLCRNSSKSCPSYVAFIKTVATFLDKDRDTRPLVNIFFAALSNSAGFTGRERKKLVTMQKDFNEVKHAKLGSVKREVKKEEWGGVVTGTLVQAMDAEGPLKFQLNGTDHVLDLPWTSSLHREQVADQINWLVGDEKDIKHTSEIPHYRLGGHAPAQLKLMIAMTANAALTVNQTDLPLSAVKRLSSGKWCARIFTKQLGKHYNSLIEAVRARDQVYWVTRKDKFDGKGKGFFKDDFSKRLYEARIFMLTDIEESVIKGQKSNVGKSSKFQGVRWHRTRQLWHARAGTASNKHGEFIGYYKREYDAAYARDFLLRLLNPSGSVYLRKNVNFGLNDLEHQKELVMSSRRRKGMTGAACLRQRCKPGKAVRRKPKKVRRPKKEEKKPKRILRLRRKKRVKKEPAPSIPSLPPPQIPDSESESL